MHLAFSVLDSMGKLFLTEYLKLNHTRLYTDLVPHSLKGPELCFFGEQGSVVICAAISQVIMESI